MTKGLNGKSCPRVRMGKTARYPHLLHFWLREWLDSGTMYSIISSIAEIPFKHKQVATAEKAIYHWVKKPSSDEGPEKSHTDALL